MSNASPSTQTLRCRPPSRDARSITSTDKRGSLANSQAVHTPEMPPPMTAILFVMPWFRASSCPGVHHRRGLSRPMYPEDRTEEGHCRWTSSSGRVECCQTAGLLRRPRLRLAVDSWSWKGSVNPPRCIMSVDCGAVKALTPSDGIAAGTAQPYSHSCRWLGVIRLAGGKAVLAHPGIYHRVRNLDDAVPRMAEAGLAERFDVGLPVLQLVGEGGPQGEPSAPPTPRTRAECSMAPDRAAKCPPAFILTAAPRPCLGGHRGGTVLA